MIKQKKRINIKEVLRFLLTPKMIYRIMKYYYYYSSIHEIKHSLQGKLKIYTFPFFGKGKFKTNIGERINIPRKYWATIPNIAKIIRYGAHTKWENDILYIIIKDVTFAIPPFDNSVLDVIIDVFIEDGYGINNINIKEKSVIDIGANIGDSSIVFAKAGAKVVYAFEPLPILHEFLEKNISLNGYEGIIKAHPVGLSDKNEVVNIWTTNYLSAGVSSVVHKDGIRPFSPVFSKQNLKIVEARTYFQQNNIDKVDVLKMDCEHCEYALLKDDSLLKYLNPEIIILEFHAGAERLTDILKSCGYQVTTNSKSKQLGLLFGTKQLSN